MTVEDAAEFFQAVPPIRDKMAMLVEVGLGYVKVGQQATTLSGGEAQRVKLAKELSRRATGNTLYILDEPTTGLHFEDVRKLLEVLHALVEQGNTVVVIEHNLDVIKTADWIVDLGPEGGVKGGEIVAVGTPKWSPPNRVALREVSRSRCSTRGRRRRRNSDPPRHGEGNHAGFGKGAACCLPFRATPAEAGSSRGTGEAIRPCPTTGSGLRRDGGGADSGMTCVDIVQQGRLWCTGSGTGFGLRLRSG
jgi:hypothetical protein